MLSNSIKSLAKERSRMIRVIALSLFFFSFPFFYYNVDDVVRIPSGG